MNEELVSQSFNKNERCQRLSEGQELQSRQQKSSLSVLSEADLLPHDTGNSAAILETDPGRTRKRLVRDGR